MEQNNSIKLFEDKNIRVAWNEDEENWYFSVVDIVAVLTDNDYQAGRKYWKTLKMRLNTTKKFLILKMDIIIMNQYVEQEMKIKRKMLLKKMQRATKQVFMMLIKIFYIIIGQVYRKQNMQITKDIE